MSGSVIFAGTPVFAATILEALLKQGTKVVAVLTQPDRQAGRGQQALPSPVKQLALQQGLTVLQPESLKSAEIQDALAALHADAMIVAAYGLILPQAVLALFPYGCINVHASLLPRWRGAAPIQRALLAGDSQTGVGIMQMQAGLDTGPVWQEASIAIESDDTAGSLHDKLAALGANLLVSTLPQILSGQLQATPQTDMDVTYAHKISKEEAQINWYASAVAIARHIRAFNPWPGAYTKLAGKLVKVWRASVLAHDAASLDATTTQAPGTIIAHNNEGIVVACGDGALVLTLCQLPGGKIQPTPTLLCGHQHLFALGECFG